MHTKLNNILLPQWHGNGSFCYTGLEVQLQNLSFISFCALQDTQSMYFPRVKSSPDIQRSLLTLEFLGTGGIDAVLWLWKPFIEDKPWRLWYCPANEALINGAVKWKASHTTKWSEWPQVWGESTDCLAGVCVSLHAVLCLEATLFLLSLRGIYCHMFLQLLSVSVDRNDHTESNFLSASTIFCLQKDASSMCKSLRKASEPVQHMEALTFRHYLRFFQVAYPALQPGAMEDLGPTVWWGACMHLSPVPSLISLVFTQCAEQEKNPQLFLLVLLITWCIINRALLNLLSKVINLISDVINPELFQPFYCGSTFS